jgi:hypothetical protein
MALTTAQKLVEAEAALHSWMTGDTVAQYTDQNGESVRYAGRASLSQLRAYIAELKNEIANPGVPLYRGPLKFLYGRRPY